MAKFLHAMIRVKDIKKSLDFYQNLFNLNLTNEMQLEDCKLYFLSDQDGQTQIELTHNDQTPEEGYEIGSGFGHFAFGVSNMDEFSKKMTCLGYEYLYEPFKLEPYDLNIAFLKDPDGYEIEVIED